MCKVDVFGNLIMFYDIPYEFEYIKKSLSFNKFHKQYTTSLDLSGLFIASDLQEYFTPRLKMTYELKIMEAVESFEESFSEDCKIDYKVPEGLKYLNFQSKGIELIKKYNGNVLLADEMGLGKAQPFFSKILTPRGFKYMRDVKVGEAIINSFGHISKITGIFPQGEQDVYRITFMDESSTLCTKEHLWTVYDKKLKVSRTIETIEIMKDPTRFSLRNIKKIAKFIMPENHKRYTLKQLVGIGEAIKQYPDKNHEGLSEDILFSPNREGILNGLADINKGIYYIKIHSLKLLNDIKFIIRSLGWSAIVEEKKEHWCIKINKKYYYNPIKSVEKEGRTECQCISVDSRDHLYVTDDLILTHNTIQSIGYINNEDFDRILIVCSPALKYNWQKELKKWLVDKSYRINIISESSMEISDINVVTYDFLSRNKNIYSYLENAAPFDLLILDEAHKIKNKKAKRYEQIKNIKKLCKRCVSITGSPIVNRPYELYTLLKLYDHFLLKDYRRFVYRYCDGKKEQFGINVKGFSNLEELNIILRNSFMIRRLRKDVSEVPQKTRKYIMIDPNKRERRILDQELESYNYDLVLSQQNNIFKLRQQVAELKLNYIIDTIKEFLEDGKKVVVFAYHRIIIDKLYDLFSGITVKATGTETSEEIQKSVDRFQNDTDIRLFVGSLKTAAEGITLTAADTILFAEIEWSPGLISQCEDRVFRHGLEHEADIFYLLYSNSVDERILEVAWDKKEKIGKILDDI